MRRVDVLIYVLSTALAITTTFSSCADSRAESSVDETVKERSRVEEYLTKKVENIERERTLLIRGGVKPVNKIVLTAEIGGKSQLSSKRVKEGVHFKKGEIILSIDATESEYALHASRSRYIGAVNRVMSTLQMEYPDQFDIWQAYLNSYNLETTLPEIPKVEDPKLKNYLISNGIYELYYSVKSQESRFEKFQIRAPFSGSITSAYIQSGEMVSPNMKIAEFSGDYAYEMEASISLKDMSFIDVGDEVELFSSDFNRSYIGKVIRINDKLEEQTQSLKIYLSVNDSNIKGGMFLEGSISSSGGEIGYPLSRNLLKRNNEVYVIRNSTVHLVEVSPLFYQDNMVIVSGLKDGDLLINEVVNSPISGTKAQSKN